MIRRTAAVLFVVAAFSCSAAPEREAFPAFTNYVVDAADVVPDNAEQTVNAELEAYEARSGGQIAVAVIDTTGSKSIEDYTIDLAKEWGVGSGEEDDGVLLLIAMEDRKLRIEVGEGVEGDLTDLESGRIIREHVTPLLQDEDVGGAVLVGTREIRRALGDEEVEAQEPPPQDTGEDDGRGFPAIGFVFLPVIIGSWIASAARRRRRASSVFWGGGTVASTPRAARRERARRRHDDDGDGWLTALLLGGLLLGGGRRGGGGWGDFGGGGDGGFGGGGGGDFGGGGASGDW